MHPYSVLTLSTDRLELRPLVAGDAPALLEIFSDPAVTRYGSSPPWKDLQVANDAIARDIRSAAEGVCFRLGLFRREDGALIGTCTLFSIDAQCRRAEIGYALAASEWGKGYASEAVTALLAYGFDEMKLNRIEADIDPLNVASARALERQGFVKEGHLKERWIVDGQVSDSVIYGLLASGFQARRTGR